MISCFLDSIFKNKSLSVDTFENVKSWLLEESEETEISLQFDNTKQKLDVDKPSCSSSVDSVYESLLGSQEPEREPEQQLRLYISEPLANRKTTDPLQWWTSTQRKVSFSKRFI